MQLTKPSIVLLAAAAWLLIASPTLADNAASGGAANEAEDNKAVSKAEGSTQMAARIDAVMEQTWAIEHIEPAPLASDGEFLRRAYLDLNGVIPRAAEVREFLANDNRDKRVQLVDRLVASPRYSTHMATVWRNRIFPTGVDPARGPQAVALQKWLRTRFAKNLRYDNLVGELLLTLGGDELGPALYYQANDLSPEKLATNTAELFLGVHLHCAQCHDHPTAAWTQKDFWGLAAFFARVKAPEQERNNPMQMSYRLVDSDEGDVRLPESTEIVPPKYPGGELASDEAQRTRRLQLALWLTSRDNDYFSRAAVNWAWSQLFGRGLVESLDDNTAKSANAQLLNELALYFVESGYDLRNLWRTLATTRLYQLSGRESGGPAAPPKHFERMLAKPLTPEQLYDSFSMLTPLARANAGPYAAQVNNPTGGLAEDPLRADFVRRMRPPPGSATEFRAGTLQALMLMNGRAMADMTATGSSNLLGAINAPFMSDAERIDALFLSTLARAPESDESSACVAVLTSCKDQAERDRALSDILWALLNCTEFAFNQ
jgi:hypothetical protein